MRRSLPREALQGGKIRSEASRCIQRRGRHHLCCPTFHPLLIILAPPMCFQIRCVNIPMVICRCSVQGRAKRPFVEMKMRTCPCYPTAMKSLTLDKRSGTNLYPMSASVGLHILTSPILLKNLLFNLKIVLAASKSSSFIF